MNCDHAFMARALELARKGLYSTHPNPRVGCVIVNDGRIVGEERQTPKGRKRPKGRTRPIKEKA